MITGGGGASAPRRVAPLGAAAGGPARRGDRELRAGQRWMATWPESTRRPRRGGPRASGKIGRGRRHVDVSPTLRSRGAPGRNSKLPRGRPWRLRVHERREAGTLVEELAAAG